MPASSAMLESARLAIVAHHGETLTRIPATSVLKSERGQVITTEHGKAVVTDESVATEFDGVFDEAYQTINIDGSIASTGPAVTDVAPSDVSGVKRGDLVINDGVQYFVIDVRPDGIASVILILSKQAH